MLKRTKVHDSNEYTTSNADICITFLYASSSIITSITIIMVVFALSHKHSLTHLLTHSLSSLRAQQIYTSDPPIRLLRSHATHHTQSLAHPCNAQTDTLTRTLTRTPNPSLHALMPPLREHHALTGSMDRSLIPPPSSQMCPVFLMGPLVLATWRTGGCET